MLLQRCRLPLRSGRRYLTAVVPPEQELARDFIRRALYDPEAGYFVQQDVIISLGQPLQFRSMLGEWDYRWQLKKAYDAKPQAWMTPAEVFRPYYSEVIARYILEEARQRGLGTSPTAPLLVYEVGGGSGTNARAVLDLLQREAPEEYEHTRYTMLEASPRLAAVQRRNVAAAHPHSCHVVQSAAEDWAAEGAFDSSKAEAAAELGVIDERPCFVLALEVLDNLPHDRVVYLPPHLSPSDGGGASLKGRRGGAGVPWEGLYEAVVVPAEAESRLKDLRLKLEERLQPLSDPLITQVLQACPSWLEVLGGASHANDNGGNSSHAGSNSSNGSAAGTRGWLQRLLGLQRSPRPQSAWLPTGAMRLLSSLHRSLPRHGLILADFDSLPPPSLQEPPHDALLAFGAPLVSGAWHSGAQPPAAAAAAAAAVGKIEAVPEARDLPTYLAAPGSADIFFPTDFLRLRAMYASACGRPPASIEVMKQCQFVERFGGPALDFTVTASGYNPMVEDFSNASFLLAEAPC